MKCYINPLKKMPPLSGKANAMLQVRAIRIESMMEAWSSSRSSFLAWGGWPTDRRRQWERHAPFSPSYEACAPKRTQQSRDRVCLAPAVVTASIEHVRLSHPRAGVLLRRRRKFGLTATEGEIIGGLLVRLGHSVIGAVCSGVHSTLLSDGLIGSLGVTCCVETLDGIGTWIFTC